MNVAYFLQTCAVLVNILLGIVVFRTNSKRGVNQLFFILTIVLVSWLTCLKMGFMASANNDLEAFEFWVRQSSSVGIFIPMAFYLLRLSVIHCQDSFLSVLRRGYFWLGVNVLLVILCQTDFYLTHAIQYPLEHGGWAVAEPVYGLGFSIYVAYFIIALIFLIVKLTGDLRLSTGMQRVELQFITLGCASGILVGAACAMLIPLLITGHSQSIKFAPMSVIVLDSVIAYGIATRRLMNVGDIIRRGTAYILLTCYLVLIYLTVWILTGALSSIILLTQLSLLNHITAALVVAFSLAPAHGLMQEFANRLFINTRGMDVSTTIENTTRILQSIRTLKDLSKEFSHVIAESVGTDTMTMLLKNEDNYEQIYPEYHDTYETIEIKRDNPIIDQLTNSHESIVLDDLNRRRQTSTVDGLIREMTLLSAAIAVGIYSRNELVGVMLLGARLSGRIYGKIEQNMLQIVCGQLAVALENAQLFTQTQDSNIYNQILLDSLVSGVIAVNNDGVITVYNSEAQRLCGLPGRDVLNQHYKLLPKSLANVITVTLRDGERLRDLEIVIRRGEDSELPLRLGSSNFEDHSGNRIGALIVFHDVSTIKQLETQIRRSDRLASIGKLSAGMAHEIKNPLVAIKTFAQLLPERYDDNDFRDTFNLLITEEVERIDTIVNRLLKFSRPSPPMLNPVHLNDILDHSLHLLSHRLEQSQINVHRSTNGVTDIVNADTNQLQQVFFNFILNSTEAMKRGGEIYLYTKPYHRSPGSASRTWNLRKVEDFIQITIKDTGTGIKKEHLSHIFDPFFTNKAEGTGMGLAVSHRIIQEHGGDIHVESEFGKYTIFRINLPLHKNQVII